MPNLSALGQRGVVFMRHHSVYPTVTRVNASSISTGSYPETHGLMGNTVFFPQVDATKFLDTSDRSNLVNIGNATGGKLLTAPTLAESLQASGQRLLVVSSGSSGSAFLLNHTVAGGAILHLEYALPETLQREMIDTLGPAPADDAPNLDQHAVDAFLKIGLTKIDPTVTIMWLSDLDTTAHAKGIGSQPAVDVLRSVDAKIKQIEDGLKAAGLFDSYNIWVTSDHGFATHTGAPPIQAILKPHVTTLSDGSPSIVTGGGAIYVRDHRDETVTAITRALQQTPGVGAIFTRGVAAGSLDGRVPGTLSFDAARWGHERAAEILFSPDWTDETNANGFPGTSASNGVAGHGSSSPFEIHNTLIAAGPRLKSGLSIEVPSGNVDFAPTFLSLLGHQIPSSMQGRVLREGLKDGPDPGTIGVKPLEHTVANQDGTYQVTSFFSIVESGGSSYRYLDRTQVARKSPAPTTR
jgi:predicted AlkP superfamily pyrophosphatase or phosphodiesterase